MDNLRPLSFIQSREEISSPHKLLLLNREADSSLLLDPPGHCDVTVKTSHWLSYTLGNQNIGANYEQYFFTVENGDCDEDNEVGIGDYARLSSAYNSVPGDGNWDGNADLNGDESVDIGDYAIMSQNYGDSGS